MPNFQLTFSLQMPIVQDATSRPTGVTWSAPSLTTYSEYFPAYRVYTIEGNFAGSGYVSVGLI